MIFRDIARISKPAKTTFGQKAEGELHDVPAIIEQTNGMARGGSYDALSGDARAYLPGDDPYLKSIGYQIGGFYLETTLYGIDFLYRITNVAIGRASVTTGIVQHIEVELEKVEKGSA